jgi:hypothetical protein
MAKDHLCLHCGTVGKPRIRNRGSSAIEILLWLCFLVPGFLYTLWRMGRKDAYCRKCKAPNPIPSDSPLAQLEIQGRAETEARRVASMARARAAAIQPVSG